MQAWHKCAAENETFLRVFCYFAYLMLPVVTLTLLYTTPWLANDGSRCDPNDPYVCECPHQVPVLSSVVAGIEIFVLFRLFCYDMLGYDTPVLYRSDASGGRGETGCFCFFSSALYLGFAAYVSLAAVSLIFVISSNPHCGLVIFIWTLASFFFRVFPVILVSAADNATNRVIQDSRACKQANAFLI